MDKHRNYGKVPNYIHRIAEHKQMLIEQRKINYEQSKIPPGTRLLSESERLQTLEELEESRKQLNNIMERMPIAK